jgi:hypothetical protein
VSESPSGERGMVVHDSNEDGHLPCHFRSTCVSVTSLTNFILLCIYIHSNLYVSNEWSSCSSLYVKFNTISCFLKFRLCDRLCVNHDSGLHNGLV